jgi:hypothetical protein
MHEVDLMAPLGLRINELFWCAEHVCCILQFGQLLINILLNNGCRSRMKVPCVIYCGLTQMTDADGGFRQEEQGTHLDKILHNNSTIQMDLALFQGPINLWWKGLIGPRLVSVVFDFSSSNNFPHHILFTKFMFRFQNLCCPFSLNCNWYCPNH